MIHLKSKAHFCRFWARAIQTASLPSQRHFLDSSTAYLRAVAVEAFEREQDHCLGIDDYLKLRRYTIGLLPCLPICEMGMNLPDEVVYHPVIVGLADCITELVLIDNVKSYRRRGLQSANAHHRT